MTMHETFEEALAKLDSAQGELVLDFSSVRRIDAGELRALENLAAQAAGKSVKLTLRGVSVGIHKVLKLSRTGLLPV